jgi:hypothetical protein
MRCLITIVATIVFATPAWAEAPSFFPVQGFLTAKDGAPIDKEVSVLFAIYGAAQGGQKYWDEIQDVTPQDGHFTVFLGFVNPLDLSFFIDHGSLWLGITVGEDSEMQRIFLGSVPFAAYAEHCGTIPGHQHDLPDLKNVAKAGQLCSQGTLATGIDANGNLICSDAGGGPGNFALSGQYCSANNVMSGIDLNGYPVCVPGAGMFSGADFAISNQQCYGDEVVTGISGSGAIICDPAGGSGGISGSGQNKRLALWKDSDELEESIVTESSSKIGINNTSPQQTLDVKGNLKVSGEIYWGGNKFTSSSCLVVGGSSCSSACSAHGMSCYKAFRIDGDSTSDSCSQSGFKFCCCKD